VAGERLTSRTDAAATAPPAFSGNRRSFTQVVASPARETFWRTLQTFNVTRVVIAVVLLIYLVFNVKKTLPDDDQILYLEICVAYLLLAIGLAILVMYYQRRFLLQALSQIAIDIAVISILYAMAGGAKSGLAILYLFPLAGCAVLAPLIWALFFVSAVTLFLLGESLYQLMRDVAEVSLPQSGLYGAAFFAAVLVINRLAAKLIKQEELAVRHGMDLQLQQAINRLVIADMGDGILVVTRDGAVLTANPAAERMLGLSHGGKLLNPRLSELAGLAPLADAFTRWLAVSAAADGATLDAGDRAVFVTVKPGSDVAGASTVHEQRRELATHLKLRFARVSPPGLAEDRVVVFLQDVTEIENQAQQLKLASMGRLTASIAHEVRNPLSAISYAASLLAEEETNAAQQRLLAIVGDNVARLNRMIEDILRLSRKAQAPIEPLALALCIEEIASEFEETHALSPGILAIGRTGPWRVRFDPMHLREVVVNLLSNAVRYASGQPGSIRIQFLPNTVGRLELHVQDDGPPITPEVRAHLFEPFYTTSSKGTGLGLYLARELCLNNGAMLDYEYHMEDSLGSNARAGGRFVITLAIADAL
jgi:two-component system sensor histidine kinase PilS (NtrC family)